MRIEFSDNPKIPALRIFLTGREWFFSDAPRGASISPYTSIVCQDPAAFKREMGKLATAIEFWLQDQDLKQKQEDTDESRD